MIPFIIFNKFSIVCPLDQLVEFILSQKINTRQNHFVFALNKISFSTYFRRIILKTTDDRQKTWKKMVKEEKIFGYSSWVQTFQIGLPNKTELSRASLRALRRTTFLKVLTEQENLKDDKEYQAKLYQFVYSELKKFGPVLKFGSFWGFWSEIFGQQIE